MRPTQGVTFGGRYELESRIAIGGMGEVWEATDHVIGRTVAIKILKDEYMGDPGFLERFRAEARHAALVNHEGIASVFDYGEENGSAFLVMELVPGEALSTIVERDGQLSVDQTLDVIAQTSAALQSAHTAGLVHRDIKPGNLLITPDGRVKITDFGIARIADQVPLTATGQVMGTVQYLSPEQASGHPASPATDTYSLGIVAYECLAGKRPFTGESQVAIAMAQINEQPPPLPETVGPPVANLVMAMIAKKPEERPASAASVARAATALRRGDINGAIAAVPAIGTGVIAGAAADDVTQLFAGQTAATTAALPVSDSAESLQPERKKRSPWTWPLIALIALFAIVLIGTIVALANQGDDAKPSPSPSSSSASATPSVKPSPTPTLIEIADLGLIGKPCEEARAILVKAGIVGAIECEEGEAVTSDDQVPGTVYKYEPQGNLSRDKSVTLTFYTERAGMPKPATPQFTAPEVEAGDTITVKWQGYSCPAGEGNPSSYTLNAVNGTFDNGQKAKELGGDARTAQVTAIGEVGSSVQVTYLVTCTGGPSGTRDSGASSDAVAPIVAPPDPEPEPEPTT